MLLVGRGALCKTYSGWFCGFQTTRRAKSAPAWLHVFSTLPSALIFGKRMAHLMLGVPDRVGQRCVPTALRKGNVEGSACPGKDALCCTARGCNNHCPCRNLQNNLDIRHHNVNQTAGTAWSTTTATAPLASDRCRVVAAAMSQTSISMCQLH